MRRNTLLADVGMAIVLVVIVLIVTPGLAVVGMISLVALALCAASLVLERRRVWRRRSAAPARRRGSTGTRSPARRSDTRARRARPPRT